MLAAQVQPQHRRTHNILLINRLLNQRDNASPFTLITDSLEQTSGPVIREFVRRAKLAKNRVVFVSFETLKPPHGVDRFVRASRLLVTQPESLREEIHSHLPTASASSASGTRTLLIIDSLNQLCSQPLGTPVPQFLSSLITPSITLVATYHTDVPLSNLTGSNPYEPSPLTLLTYLATTLITAHSISYVLAATTAANRSQSAPVHGLAEEKDGVITGLGRNGSTSPAIVLEVEHRRKSGRGVREWYVLPRSLPRSTRDSHSKGFGRGKADDEISVILLEDYPDYRRLHETPDLPSTGGGSGEESIEEQAATFSMSLTEKQRRDREEVVLPYFDAQTGGGEGGRILYEMGAEDDFDEEEDEI